MGLIFAAKSESLSTSYDVEHIVTCVSLDLPVRVRLNALWTFLFKSNDIQNGIFFIRRKNVLFTSLQNKLCNTSEFRGKTLIYKRCHLFIEKLSRILIA